MRLFSPRASAERYQTTTKPTNTMSGGTTRLRQAGMGPVRRGGIEATPPPSWASARGTPDGVPAEDDDDDGDDVVSLMRGPPAASG